MYIIVASVEIGSTNKANVRKRRTSLDYTIYGRLPFCTYNEAPLLWPGSMQIAYILLDANASDPAAE